MNYPKTRLRRLRYNKNIRELFEDIKINKSDLIQPVFLVEGNNIKKEIKSLKGQYQLSIDNAITFFTLLSIAASITFIAPITFVLIHSNGLYSAVGTILRAAACTT